MPKLMKYKHVYSNQSLYKIYSLLTYKEAGNIHEIVWPSLLPLSARKREREQTLDYLSITLERIPNFDETYSPFLTDKITNVISNVMSIYVLVQKGCAAIDTKFMLITTIVLQKTLCRY